MSVYLLSLATNDDLSTLSTTALGTIRTIRRGRGVFFSFIRVQRDRKGVYWRGFPLDFLNRDMSIFLGIDLGGLRLSLVYPCLGGKSIHPITLDSRWDVYTMDFSGSNKRVLR